MRRIFLVLLALGALAVPTSAGAASCRTADSCKSLEHDSTANAAKTVNVDAAGTVLVGGSGSRVELLYSGTHTELATGSGAGSYGIIKAAFAPPSWAKQVWFVARIDAITIGAGATLIWSGFTADATGDLMTSSAGEERGLEAAAVVTPTENNSLSMVFGPDVPVLNTALGGVSRFSYPIPPYPMVGLSYNWVTAPTSWSVRWYVYGVGG